MISRNIIGFELSGASGRQIHSFNPSTQQPIEFGFDVATLGEVNHALEKAMRAWRIYRNMPGTGKAEFLREIAIGIEGLGADLVQTIAAETAYPEARIITERNRTCAQLRMFADLTEAEGWREIIIDKALPARLPVPRPELRRMMMPIGPVVVFGASNFPLAYSTMGGDAASALAVGCPVIIKAHESHLCTNALVAEVVMKAARKTNMPDGVFSSLHGDGLETGKQLVLHPYTAAIGFTGSFKGGKALFDLGATREKPIPVFAEMGSVNPVFILPKTIHEKGEGLVDQLVTSMTLTVGQFCTQPGILVIQKEKETEWWLGTLKTALEKIEPSTMLNAGIAKNFHDRTQVMRDDPLVNLLLSDNIGGQKAAPVLATVEADTFLRNPKLHLEIFGPYSIVVMCADENEFLMVAQIMEGQLTSSIFFHADETDQVGPLIEILVEKAGRIIFNGVPTGVEVCAAMTHGGPFPATTDARFTAVGQTSVRRWLRPVTFQNAGKEVLPDVLQDRN